MNKNTIIIVIVIAIVIIGGLVWNQSMKDKKEVLVETPVQVLDRQTKSDTTAQINADLDAIDSNQSDADFQDVDAELNTL